MAKTVEVPGIGPLSAGPYGDLVSEPHRVAALGRDCQFVCDAMAEDPHPEDFVQAVHNIMAAGESLLGEATEHVHQYCVDMQAMWGDEAPTLDISKPADVWNYVDLGAHLYLYRDDETERDVYVSLECNCAWEEEHGLHLAFLNGSRISKVGPYDGHVTNPGGVIYERIGE